MKVLFVQNFWQPYLGICYIASVLKSRGHACALVIAQDEDNLLKKLEYKIEIDNTRFVDSPKGINISWMGGGISHNYEILDKFDITLIYDHATQLIWHQSTLIQKIDYGEVNNEIAKYNLDNIAGFNSPLN